MPVNKSLRSEREILADLANLCASTGYVHAIAYLCFRDSLVSFTGEMKPEDMQHLFSESRLIRTEIMTLVGYLIKNEIDYTIPQPETLRKYVETSDALLQELHLAMSGTIFASLDTTKISDPNFNPFNNGEKLREPIFYGGESAYVFQYRDFALRKYLNDDEWLLANKGFSITDARHVVHIISRLQDKKVMAVVRSLRDKSPEEWTVLPGFDFSVQEVADECRLDMQVVRKVLDAFSLPATERNT